MSQEPIGKAIKDAFLFLKPIFSDTARIMRIVEETMNRNKLFALWGAAAVWGRSYAYYGDYGWLTHYLTRLFVKPPRKEEKPSFKEKKGAFVNVYFAPEKLSQPIVVYGVIHTSDENIWPCWQSLIAVNDGPQFVTTDKVSEWKDANVDYPGLETLAYSVLPLTELINKERVESLCNDTIEMFNKLRS